MKDIEILANAPEGATHFDFTYVSIDTCFYPSGKRISGIESRLEESTRNISDIQTIVDLRRENAELEKERDQILKSALDSESNYCDLKDSLPAHNLEQQKLALLNLIGRGDNSMSHINFLLGEIDEQTKALKKSKS